MAPPPVALNKDSLVKEELPARRERSQASVAPLITTGGFFFTGSDSLATGDNEASAAAGCEERLDNIMTISAPNSSE